MIRTALLSILTLLLSTPCLAGYSVFVRSQVTPQYIQVYRVAGMETVRNPGPPPARPVAFIRQICAATDIYSADPAARSEVWEDPAGTLSQAEVLAICPTALDAKYQRLWEAASAWERRNISGVALSLLPLGVSQGKPKAMAIAAWSSRLWNDTYYPRKALVNLDTEPDYDFSTVGDMPYSVPELSLEVWGQ